MPLHRTEDNEPPPLTIRGRESTKEPFCRDQIVNLMKKSQPSEKKRETKQKRPIPRDVTGYLKSRHPVCTEAPPRQSPFALAHAQRVPCVFVLCRVQLPRAKVSYVNYYCFRDGSAEHGDTFYLHPCFTSDKRPEYGIIFSIFFCKFSRKFGDAVHTCVCFRLRSILVAVPLMKARRVLRGLQ